MDGILRAEDILGEATTIRVAGLDPADSAVMTKMAAFASSVRSYINPAITQYGVIRTTSQKLTPPNTKPSNAAERSGKTKGMLHFRYVEDAQNKAFMLRLPAPALINGWSKHETVGYRFMSMEGAAMAAQLATLTGITDLSYVEGYLNTINSKGNGAMPTFQAGVVKMVDWADNVYMLNIPNCTDIAKLATFAQYLQDYTNCAIETCYIVTPDVMERSDTADSEFGYDSVEEKIKAKFRYVLNNKAHTATLSLPGVKENHTLYQSGDDYKHLVKVSGEGVALALKALSGSTKNYRYMDSKQRVKKLGR
jgi:hypothetical protein